MPGVSAHLVPVLLEARLAITGGEVAGVVHHLQLAEDASARQYVHLHLFTTFTLNTTIELGYFVFKSVSKYSNIQTVVNFLVIPNYLNSRTEL